VQDVQKRQSADARKLISANGDLLVFVNDIDVVPSLTSAGDRSKGLLVVVLEVRERLIRKDYAPAESIVWPVAFEEGDLVRPVELLHQDCKVESRWPASDDCYFHYSLVWTTLRWPPPFIVKAPQLLKRGAATEGHP